MQYLLYSDGARYRAVPVVAQRTQLKPVRWQENSSGPQASFAGFRLSAACECVARLFKIRYEEVKAMLGARGCRVWRECSGR